MKTVTFVVVVCAIFSFAGCATPERDGGSEQGGPMPEGGGGGSGACDPAQICPTVYEPVCGLDGNTYSNACEASCVGVASEGTCESGPGGGVGVGSGGECDGPEICREEYAPECGVDGNTYSNDCFRAQACVDLAYPGPCGGI